MTPRAFVATLASALAFCACSSTNIVGDPNASIGRLPNAGRVLRFTASTTGPGYVANGALQDPQPVANGKFGSRWRLPVACCR